MIKVGKNAITSSEVDGTRLGTIRRNWRSFFILLALCTDSFAVFVSNLIAGQSYDIWRIGLDPYVPPLIPSTLVLCSVFIFMGLVTGLYRAAYHARLSQQYALAVRAYFYSVVFITTLLFLARAFQYSRAYMLLFLLVLPVIFTPFRGLLNLLDRSLRRRGFGIFNALIVEVDHRFDQVLFNRFQSFPELGYSIHGHFKRRGSGKRNEKLDLTELVKVVRNEHIDCIFIPTLKIIENGYSQLISLCEENRIKLKLVSKESDDLLRFVYVTDIAGIALFSPPRWKIQFAKRAAKRIFDIFAAAISIAILSPVFVAVSTAILIEDGWPVLYRQERGLNLGGEKFTFLKFRSMHKGADAKQREMYAANERSGGLFLVRRDPRLTKVGRIIRKFSIDELPQLINVLFGQMSLVGPRPLTIGDLENITQENKMGGYYHLRSRGKPGMTGLWQICGRREVGFREMVLLDLYYIENQSILFDFEILLQTIPVVLFGKGAY